MLREASRRVSRHENKLIRRLALARRMEKGAEAMDRLDVMIAERLQEDATATNSKIAESVKVSEETVRRRLKKLLSDGMIEIVAVPDAAKLGFNSLALVGIQVEVDKVDDVARSLKRMPQVTRLIVTTGSYDMFAWANLESTDNLSEFLRRGIGQIDGVRKMETFIVLSVEKEQYGVNMGALRKERHEGSANAAL